VSDVIKQDQQYVVYFHCQTTLVDMALTYHKKRA
jgi:hypothetical protein